MEKNSVQKFIDILSIKYSDAHCALKFSNPFQLLIATILSAQCTDERVNLVTPILFLKFDSIEKLAQASIGDIEKIIHSTGFYKNKARNIKLCSQKIMSHYSGAVPSSLEELVSLAGVGRKTAHVVLGNAFHISSGVVVDTHVSRLAQRFHLVKKMDAVKIESKLNQMIPQKYWIQWSHWLIAHGRQICKARKPNCTNCCLKNLCPSYFSNP